MAKRKKRDIYGNWVWEDAQDIAPSSNTLEKKKDKIIEEPIQQNEGIGLDWRDYIALTIASLETFLLPLVVLILLLLGIVLALAFFR